MKFWIVGVVLLSFCGLAVNSLAQDQNQPVAQTDTPPPNPGIEPKAPPVPVGAIVLPADCLVVPNSAMEVGRNDTTPGKQFGLVAQVRVFMTLNAAQTGWDFNCGVPDKKWGYDATIAGGFNGGVMTKTQVSVWTAAESKAQFDFLRAEVKSMITEAVLNKVVNDKTVQESVGKALEKSNTVSEAVKTALQNNEVFQKAVSAALQEALPSFKEAIIKEVLQRMPNQTASASN